MNQTFLKLIAQLSLCGNDPIVDDHANWLATLRALYRLNHVPAHEFLTRINNGASPNESPSELLLRSHQMAKAFLPELLRQYRDEKAKTETETNHDRFLSQQAESDPFLGDDTQLTRDAFAGQGNAEPGQLAKLDAWGNVIQS
jgi:hypothetical protein